LIINLKIKKKNQDAAELSVIRLIFVAKFYVVATFKYLSRMYSKTPLGRFAVRDMRQTVAVGVIKSVNKISEQLYLKGILQEGCFTKVYPGPAVSTTFDIFLEHVLPTDALAEE